MTAPFLPTQEPAMVFKPIHQSRTSREVERQIEGLILEGILQAGDRLPGERDLSEHLGVSRPIVREALANLEQRQLLVARHGGGTFVADVIGTVFAKPVVDLIPGNPKAKSDYLEYRREIEAITASLAAQRATYADKALLTGLMDDMERAHLSGDPEQEAKIDVAFHSAIGECAHNIILLHTLRACYRLLSEDVFLNRHVLYEREGMREKLLVQHRAIYQAIMDGDGETAAKAAQNHINFIQSATQEAEQWHDRQAVSSLRLAQRTGQTGGKENRTSKQTAKAASGRKPQ